MGTSSLKFINGIAEEKADTWEDFCTLAFMIGEHPPTYDGTLQEQFVFRGLDKSSPGRSAKKSSKKDEPVRLQSSFHRLYGKTAWRPNKPTHAKQAEAHLKRFRQAMRGKACLADRDMSSYLEVWSIAQHFGLQTPLLDWTASPFVAAFFAYQKQRMVELTTDEAKKAKADIIALVKTRARESRTVWCLNETAIEGKFRTKLGRQLRNDHQSEYAALLRKGYLDEDLCAPYTQPDQLVAAKVIAILDGVCPASEDMRNACRLSLEEVEQQCVRICRPRSGENTRIIPQRGLFTYYTGDKDIWKWIDDEFRGTKEHVLVKIDLKNDKRESFLKNLEIMEIDHLLAFPDLIGVSDYCNHNFSRGGWAYAYPAT